MNVGLQALDEDRPGGIEVEIDERELRKKFKESALEDLCRPGAECEESFSREDTL